MSENAASYRRTATRSLVLCALMAALTAICSQIQIPLPMVPINLALFAVHLSGALLGWKYGALSMVVYALLGVIGVPVFAGFGSGPAVLFGKTGGYILGFGAAALIYWLVTARLGASLPVSILACVLGLLVCYTFGTAWFLVAYARSVGPISLTAALGMCVFPFVLPDLIKLALAVLLSRRVGKFLR